MARKERDIKVANEPLGKEFIKIIHSDVLNDISKATVSLHLDLIQLDQDAAIEIIDNLTSNAKKVIDCYIEQQKITLLEVFKT